MGAARDALAGLLPVTGDPAVRVALTRRRDALRKALGVVRAAADLARRGAGAHDVETWVDSADGPGPH